jgi:diaminohydroxyphosphoribosylaminopyrimidine deaminase/5-amino-6-(5-phosphoribosylamino)uracil reductase
MNRPTQLGQIQHELDAWHMRRALDLAELGRGTVEPNPLVGCVIARGAEIIGEGYHRRYGGPHAEIEALSLAGDRAAGATLYVTLEPCCHFGKTPPCTQAVIAAGIKRVVAAMADPFPQVAGKGVTELRAAGIDVEIGLHEAAARSLNAPYLKLLGTGRPWVIAKWAMTLDGKLATAAGDSVWISNEASRAVVHQLRGRVDAIVVAAGTARADDPLLTARPPGARTALRIVVDDRASLSLESKLIKTIADAPVLVAAAIDAPPADITALRAAGCEVLLLNGPTRAARLTELFDELGRRRLTNVLVEGGAKLLGECFDAELIDEVHAFIAPKIAGGRDAPSPVGGRGFDPMAVALKIEEPRWRILEGDAYLQGRVSRRDSARV